MKRTYKYLTSFLLVFAILITTMSFTATTVKAIGPDLEQKCALRVKSANSSDLMDADVVIDVIQIAKAVPFPGYDTYTFKAVGRYHVLNTRINSVQNSDQWITLAQDIAKLALEENNWDTEGVKETVLGTFLEDLDPGLYLIVPHASGDKRTTIVEYEDGTEAIATTCQTTYHTYTFIPSLLSLPTKGGIEGENTPAADGWTYTATVSLKAEESDRLGDLEIIKSLNGYRTGSPATFVFRVYAQYKKIVNGKAETVTIDKVVSLTFDQDDRKSYLIEGLPAGVEVTVTEIYSGACYRLISDLTCNTVIQADETVSVSFTNEPTDSALDGGGVVNRFEFKDGSWDCKQSYFRAASSS